MTVHDLFNRDLDALRAQGLVRNPDDGEAWASVQRRAADLGVDPIHASSNDYLGLAREGVSRETLLACAGIRAGSGASRLIHGTQREHLELEQELADWVRLPSALVFSSGFAANVGLIAALGASGGRIVSDSLNHASLIDGCRLGRGPVEIVPHLGLQAAEAALRVPSSGPKWVVTESYFSMDGDYPDLRRLRALCDEMGAGLVVDEAHALGVFGEQGHGRCAQAGVVPDLLIGTLGKAVGVQGAFVAGSCAARTWLWNKARSFVFSTGLSPILARLATDAVRRVRRSEAERNRLSECCTHFRQALRTRGLRVPDASEGPIVPVILGDNAKAVAVASRLSERGILVQAIRPPTVPAGTARLRVTLAATMSDSQLERLAAELVAACL